MLRNGESLPTHETHEAGEVEWDGACVVPLSRQAVAILRDVHPLTGHGRYLFPSPRTGERPMSDNGVLSALRRMGFPSDEMGGHGFYGPNRGLFCERRPQVFLPGWLASTPR